MCAFNLEIHIELCESVWCRSTSHTTDAHLDHVHVQTIGLLPCLSFSTVASFSHTFKVRWKINSSLLLLLHARSPQCVGTPTMSLQSMLERPRTTAVFKCQQRRCLHMTRRSLKVTWNYNYDFIVFFNCPHLHCRITAIGMVHCLVIASRTTKWVLSCLKQ